VTHAKAERLVTDGSGRRHPEVVVDHAGTGDLHGDIVVVGLGVCEIDDAGVDVGM